VRTTDEYCENRLFGSVNVPALNEEQWKEVRELASVDMSRARLLATSLIASGTAAQLEEDEKKDCFHLGFYANHRLCQDGYHILLYCDSGQLRSASVAVLLRLAGVECSLLAGGFPEYQQVVQKTLDAGQNRGPTGLNLGDLRLIVLTGPDTMGRQQVVAALKQSEQQLLDVEEVAGTNQQKGVTGELKETGPPTMDYFHTQLFFKLSLVSKEKVIWILYEPSRVPGGLQLPKALAEKMLVATRLHVDTDLDERVQYILKTYEYIFKDETNFARMLAAMEKYAGKRPGETWVELPSRSSYKDLVADLRDVHALISKMGDGGPDLPAHLFLIAPKIDFRQISAPNFLTDS